MPKTNDNTGATIYGAEGIVTAATGRLDQVDPSRNLDGTAVDGFESDEREIPSPEEENAEESDETPDDESAPRGRRGGKRPAAK